MIPAYDDRTLTGPDNAEEDLLTVADEVLGPIDVSDLKNVLFQTTQVVDDGTVTLLLQYSLDGTYWCTLATLDESSFAAADGDSVITKLANGSTVPMPFGAKLVRVVCSAISSATAQYACAIRGERLPQ